ncbi:aromatic prenyltransferase [Streptomyces sp. NPDC002788]
MLGLSISPLRTRRRGCRRLERRPASGSGSDPAGTPPTRAQADCRQLKAWPTHFSRDAGDMPVTGTGIHRRPRRRVALPLRTHACTPRSTNGGRMSDSAELTDLYSAIEETARVMGVASSRTKVRPVLTSYQHVMAQAVISFRAQTGPRGVGDLDCRWTMLPKDLDPYALALSSDLIAETDHPVGTLPGEIHRQFPVNGYGFDFGVAGGFKKTWSFFDAAAPHSVAALGDLPSMPRSVSENLGFFTKYGLADLVNTVGIDYAKRTVNLYFARPSAEAFAPEGIQSILRDAGMPEASEQLLRFSEQAFGVYTTMSWDTPKIERVTFAARTTAPLELPVDIDPSLERLVKEAPYDTAGRQFVYGISATPKGEFHKIQSYYQWHDRVVSMLEPVDA